MYKPNRPLASVVALLAAATGCHRPSDGKTVLKPWQPPNLVEPPHNRIVVKEDGAKARLVRGFEITAEDWLWVGPDFAVDVDPPVRDRQLYMEVDLNAPIETMAAGAPLTLVASADGKEFARTTYKTHQRALFAAQLPSSAIKGTGPVRLEFKADRTHRPKGAAKPRSLIIVSVALLEYEDTQEYRAKATPAIRREFQKVVEARRKRLTAKKYSEMLRLFHETPIWESQSFQGVKILKSPLDLWVMQQIIAELKPDFVVETGTYRGGSALYWAFVLEGLGLSQSRVLTVDITNHVEGADRHPLWQKYVEFLPGSSTDPAIVAHIAERVKGKRVLVTLDSDHRMLHVLTEIRAYAPLVSRGSYLVVEDTHMDGVPTYPHMGLGPFAAVVRFMEDGGTREFTIDETREPFIMTFNPGGWLRKK
jgi:cephalosporin hydroxylase